MNFHCCIFMLLVCLCSADNVFKTEWFLEQPVDHFSFSENNTFKMRYLYNDTYWKAGGPILFYAGNEGDITLFAKNTGIMWDMAPELDALILFAEHRYYGLTMPFGAESFKTDNIGYLSSEQALADYAVFLRWFKGEIEWSYTNPLSKKAKDSPVLVLGGSYGGMLAAWMRMKYPNVVVGALAASAPIWQFHGITPCYKFAEISTRTFANSAPGCEKVVKASWNAMTQIANESNGLEWLNDKFKFCPNSTLNETSDITSSLFAYLSGSWTYMAMVDYPYPNSFLRPVPGFPVKVACEAMVAGKPTTNQAVVEAIVRGLGVFQNYTGDTECYDMTSVTTGALDDSGWNYQSCTEMVMPMCQNGSDMFYEQTWNFTSTSEGCMKQYNVRPRRNWVTTNYWGTDLSGASNIIFSNGYLDPWSGGGVLERPQGAPDSIHNILIQSGAHHLDIRSKNPGDPTDVTDARTKEWDIIKCWLGHPKTIPQSCYSNGANSISPIISIIIVPVLMYLTAWT